MQRELLVSDQRVLHRFRKNAREEVRATLGTFGGYELADIRVYVADERGEAQPTRKGIAVRVEDLPQLRAAVAALEDAVAASARGRAA
jgi:Transcriptional Coactivator p15 (PC4)